MRHAALAAVVLLAPGTAMAAPSAEGRWRTEGGTGVVEIAPCGPKLCGRLIDFPELRQNPNVTDLRNRDAKLRSRPLKGVTMLSGFSGGPAKYSGGTIYNPGDGRTYRSTMELAGPDTLKVKGCFGPICQTQTWTRAR